jgi:hypothetical protein
MVRTLSLTAIILILSSVASAQSGGYRVVDRESGFIITFPGAPQYQEGPNPVTGDRQEIYLFNYNGDILQIISERLSAPPRSQQEVSNILTGAAGIYNSSGSTLIRNVKLSPTARQFDTVHDTSTGRLYMRTHLHIVRGKMYTLSYGSYVRERYDDAIARSFFSSFSLRIPAGARTGPLSGTSPRGGRGRRESASRATGVSWQTFRSPEGDFSIEFPSIPINLSNPSPQSGNPNYQYIATFGENQVGVVYRDRRNISSQEDLSRAVREETNNYIRNARNDGWRFLSRRELPGGAAEFELEGRLNNVPVRSLVRVYVTNRRVYFVSSSTQNLTGPNAGILPRFFNSFRLLDYQ